MIYNEIINSINEIKNLGYALSLLNWDQSIFIPKNGVMSRANVIETITKIAHDMLISDILYEKILSCTESNDFKNLEEFKQKEILKIKKDVEKERKKPTDLVKEIAKTTSLAMNEWEQAKKTGNDEKYLPLLNKIFKLKKEIADAIGFSDNPYDALLDDYDEDLKYKYIEPLFNSLENHLVEIINKIEASKKNIKDDFLLRKYDKNKQWEFGLCILKKFGINFDSCRQDISTHPFTTTIGEYDVRITTNISENNFIKGFFSTLHEGGHCLYELSVNNHLNSSPFATISSLSLHESQSRFFENIIGRSYGFWKNHFNDLKKLFIENLNNVTLDDFYKAINKVKKSPIRTESDEVTYNLHIILRTQLENDLINDKINVNSINDFWHERTKKLFNFYPKTKSESYLQDIHWSDGLIGYFPTYTLGNLISAQILNAMENQMGKVNDINDEKLINIIKWLDKNIYKHGSFYSSMELVKISTNKDLTHEYFIDYLKDKFFEIYN